MMSKIKCADCKNCVLQTSSGSPARYYCTHRDVTAGVGSMMICRCTRGETDITIKSSPVWCPLKFKKRNQPLKGL